MTAARACRVPGSPGNQPADPLSPPAVRVICAEHGVRLGGPLHLSPLGGGVSGDVVLVTAAAGEQIVIKRPRPRLQVDAEWSIDRDRASNEAACLRYLAEILPAGSVPVVRFVDRDRHLFAMDVLPQPRDTWQRQLLDGIVSQSTAERVAQLLALMHRRSSENPALASAFGRDDLFAQGRIDPFHRTVARRMPALAEAIEREIERLRDTRLTLVWGDASPQNVFVYPDRVRVFDTDIAHWGDPAFDIASVMTQLLLKALVLERHRRQILRAAAVLWDEYAAAAPPWPGLEVHTVTEVGCLLVAQVEGKSPVEYVTRRDQRDMITALGASVLTSPIETVEELLERATVSSHDAQRGGR